MNARVLAVILVLLGLTLSAGAAGSSPAIDRATVASTVERLVGLHGGKHADRIRLGVNQVAQRWWAEDGDAAAFGEFCETHFVVDADELDAAAARLGAQLEQIDGHLHEIRRDIMSPLELDTGDVHPVDRMASGLDLAAHVDEDLFRIKLPFYFLLNFPVHTLSDRLENGERWDRQTWARSRMMERFDQRVPAGVAQEITRAFTEADHYIAGYNIRMDRLVTPDGERPFPEGLRLITHWGLRDELKSHYTADDGLARQRMIYEVMRRIVRQEIPAAAIDSADHLWDPASNEVWTRDPITGAKMAELKAVREPDTRYERLLDVFHAVRAADPYAPTAPTYIDRRFNLGRQIPESEVEALLTSVLKSKELRDAAALVRRKLGRSLEPFDIWYDGFRAGGRRDEAALDRLTRERYPTVQAFQDDLPRILTGLGFSAKKSAWLADHVVVDPSRGVGHAMGAVRREDKAHLRTRVGADGMDYKGYNIAVHELGHNIEQVFSLNAIDSWWLNGVPNTGFTEALAFVFQNRDLELLGVAADDKNARQLEALDTLWSTAEIGAVALLDMRVWRFMYAHPEATPAELREATVKMAREVWNLYLAPVIGVEDSEILAIYSHMIAYGLYLPDYPLGHIIAFQVAEKMSQGNLGAEFERMSRQGRLTPDAWMRGAVGQPLSTEALLREARAALATLLAKSD